MAYDPDRDEPLTHEVDLGERVACIGYCERLQAAVSFECCDTYFSHIWTVEELDQALRDFQSLVDHVKRKTSEHAKGNGPQDSHSGF